MTIRKLSVTLLVFLIILLFACRMEEGVDPTPTHFVAEPMQTISIPTPVSTTVARITPEESGGIDYQPVLVDLEAYVTDRVYDWGFDLGIAFVDIETGQVVSLRGDRRYHAMSSFKGPLAIMYFQMVESGEIEPLVKEDYHLDLMLRVSYNQSTTCFFEAIGGVPAYNDWLAENDFERQNNFVFSWNDWGCPDSEIAGTKFVDWRYSRGDEELGLPRDGVLLKCVENQLPCDKAFTPIELAQFYADLYRGEYISDDHLDEIFAVMERNVDESVFWIDMPDDTDMQVFTKGGTHQATEEYRVHFFNEAGIIETEYGAFAVAMFMQRQPEWPGTFPMAKVFRMYFDYFIENHQ